MIAEFTAVIAAHEFCHLAGCLHTDLSPTDPFAGTLTFMDKSFEAPLGPDLVVGTADNGTLQLRADLYHCDEGFSGLHGTLNTVAFGLSTGKGAAAESAGVESYTLIRPASTAVVWLSMRAADWGWFGDSAPAADRPFSTPGDQGKQNRITDMARVALLLGLIAADDTVKGPIFLRWPTSGDMALIPASVYPR